MAGVVTRVSRVAKVNPDTMAWDSGTQKVDSMLPYSIVRLTKSMLSLTLTHNKVGPGGEATHLGLFSVLRHPSAKLKAARATSSGTEAISNITVPGFTTATQ